MSRAAFLIIALGVLLPGCVSTLEVASTNPSPGAVVASRSRPISVTFARPLRAGDRGKLALTVFPPAPGKVSLDGATAPLFGEVAVGTGEIVVEALLTEVLSQDELAERVKVSAPAGYSTELRPDEGTAALSIRFPAGPAGQALGLTISSQGSAEEHALAVVFRRHAVPTYVLRPVSPPGPPVRTWEDAVDHWVEPGAVAVEAVFTKPMKREPIRKSVSGVTGRPSWSVLSSSSGPGR